MRRKHPQFNFRIMSFIVKSTFVVLMFAPVLLRISSAAAVDNNAEEQLSSSLHNYQCFTDKDDSSSKQSIRQIPIGLQVSNWPSHQLMTRIFAIFLREVLNYRKVYILPFEYTDGEDEKTKLTNILESIIKNNPEYPKISMMNLGVWVPSIGHALVPKNVQEGGVPSGPVRFGWFVAPTQVELASDYLDYTIFLNRSHPFYGKYIMDSEYLNQLKRRNANDYFESPMCKGIQCATLLAEFKNETLFAKRQITAMNGYLNIIWLGSQFRLEIDRLYSNYTENYSNNKRFLVLHWSPSDVINSKYRFQQIKLPRCEEEPSLLSSYCKYELNPIIKYYSKNLENEEPLMFAFRHFWIGKNNLQALFGDLMMKSLKTKGATNEIYNEVACRWIRNNREEHEKWVSKERITLSIGGIFPITKTSRGHQNLIHAVRKAAIAINKNTSILGNYDLHVYETDGACKSDVVMKTFLHYYVIQNLVGVLGPACSETLDPIAGISRHTNTAVISYSAEGASFFDRNAYPFFFRTVGSNRQYEDVYIDIMNEFGWKRVAALTEDGQKYTEYISHMEAAMKNNNLEMIINKKFLSDVTHTEMNKHLKELKQKRAKIIIADVHNKFADMALCEAYHLGMTAAQGYVWFLPSWLAKDWDTRNSDGNYRCTAEELKMAFDGHFSIMHSPFGYNKTIMQENITIENWLNSYSSSVDSVSQYSAFAYDAVWVYALAADKLFRENKDAVGNLRTQTVANRFVDFIWETDFEGLSGRVRFGEGGSRLSELIITQWQTSISTVEVGKYIPELIGTERNLRTNRGNLFLNQSAILWLSDKKPPEDGTYDCSFSSLAEFLNTECDTAAIVFTAALCLIAVVVISSVSFLFWKQRYNKKLKRSAKIMKNFGIDLLSPSRSNVNTLDKWEIPKENVVVNRRLGDGAFGTVYGGEAQIGTEGWTAVAVKTLKSEASTEDRIDFLSEAEAMKRFNHKNIVKLLGVCLQSEPIYTIMEFMLYGDLRTYLLARRHLVNENLSDESDISSKRLTIYTMDVARGLAYLTKQKYVHRDLACRNCLVNAQRVVKLGDFGMSRPTHESDYYRFNRKGMLPVRWMAPESLALGMFTTASDVWAFGVVIFEIITFGSVPYQGLTNNQVMEYVKSGNTLSTPIGLKPQLEGLIKACWNQDVKKRPTALEIIDYISKYPSLLTACLDFPSASVEIAETECDELELLPNGLKCSPLKNDSALDVVAQTTLANSMERFNNFANETNVSEPIDIEMSNNNNERPIRKEVVSYSPITPEGYSVMSPLLKQHTQSLSETRQ